MKTHFRSVTSYPQQENANGILMRLIDGLGFRFYWATEGLTEDDYSFSPGGGCQTIGELIGHVWGLVNWMHLNVLGEGISDQRPEDLAERREQVFQGLYDIRSHVEAIGQEELFALQIEGRPLWHMINGPLSDALTHTGQINSFRRLNGNVVPAHRPFLGH
jgi:hypothetical protein